MRTPSIARTPLWRALAAFIAALLAAAALVPLTAVSASAADLGTTSTVTVNVKALRTGVSAVNGIAGVTFALYSGTTASTDSPGAKINEAWAECVSNASGVCTFTVPNTGNGQVNHNAVYWVKQLDAPDGYYLNPSLVTGNGTNDPSNSERFASTVNAFRTPALSGSTVTLPGTGAMPANTSMTFPQGTANGQTSGRYTTSGAFAVSLDNPRYQPTCEADLEVAIVIDLSTSMVSPTDAGLAGAKTAAKAFLDALVDTGTKVSIFTFGSNANTPPQASPVEVTSANLASLKTTVNNLSVSGIQYTNWERGLWQVAAQSGAYDLAVVLTDGNPTRQGDGAGQSDTWTNMQRMEGSIFSANAIKAENTQIFTFGVGDGVTGAPDNLRAVSGEVPWNGAGGTVATSDFFQTTQWGLVADGLGSLANSLTCIVPITVTKTEILADGSTAVGSGWKFTATASGDGTIAPVGQQTTNAGGEAAWQLAIGSADGEASVSLSEDLASKPGSWSLASVQCTNTRTGTDLVVPQSLPIQLTGLTVGDNIECAVSNQLPRAASVVVTKQWVIDGAAPVPNGQQPDGLAAQLTLDGQNRGWGSAVTGFVSDTTVVIDETTTDTNEFCSITSKQLTSPTTSSLGYTASLVPGVNAFTITNTVTCESTLTLIKRIIGNDTAGGAAAAEDFTLTAEAAGQTTIAGDGTVTGSVAPGVAYTLGETGPAGYRQTALECGPSATGPWTPLAESTVTVAALTHTWCRFTNEAVAPQLRLVKTVTDGVVAADNWTLTASVDGSAVVSGDGVAEHTVKAGVAYLLAETPVNGFDDSEFTASAWACEVTSGPGQGSTLPTTDSTVTLALGQNVECEIVNTAQPSAPTFTKSPGSATANADGTWDVSYTLTASNPSSVADVVYDLTDTPNLPSGVTGVSATVEIDGVTTPVTWTTGTFTVATGATIGAGADPHVYTVTLRLSLAPTTDSADLDCAVSGGGIDNDALLTPVGSTPIPDDACVTIVPPTVAHTKTVTALQQNVDGTWTIVYDVVVTATGSGVATYSLSDVPAFGSGITVLSASATGPALAGSWNGTSSTALALNRPLAGGSSETYSVTITAQVAAEVIGTPAGDCTLVSPETGTGFLNRATLTAGGQDTVREACDVPVSPELDKEWISTVQNDDASWAVTFDVTVTNPSAATGLVYSLSDLPTFANGTTVTARTVAVNSGAPTAWDGTAPLATDRALAADSTDRYTLVFTVTVPAGLAPAVLECDAEPGHGFYNQAEATSGEDTFHAEDCGPVEDGVLPLIDKVVADGSPRQLAGGDWEIAYDITVSTPQGSPRTVYDLEDSLDFGGDIDVQTASISGPGTVNPLWDGEGVTSVATDVVLPGGASHVYTVLVTARLAAGVVGSDQADCSVGEGEQGTGFLNIATVLSGSLERSDDACATPAAPELTKELLGTPVKGGDGKVTVTYTVTATNPSDVVLNYDLDDAVAFAQYVIINSTAVQSDDATVNPGWNGSTTTRVVTGQELPAGASDVFVVTVVASPTLLVEDEELACVPATPGHGFFNGAVLTSGADQYRDDACAPILRTDLPTLPLPDLPTLAYTGVAVAVIAGPGLALIALGLLFFALRRRRQPRL